MHVRTHVMDMHVKKRVGKRRGSNRQTITLAQPLCKLTSSLHMCSDIHVQGIFFFSGRHYKLRVFYCSLSLSLSLSSSHHPKQAVRDFSISLLLDDSAANVSTHIHRGILYTQMDWWASHKTYSLPHSQAPLPHTKTHTH